MQTFPDWHAAHRQAAKDATTYGREVGIERAKEYGREVYRVFLLPAERFRQGYELRCEVVRPGDPA